MWNWFVVLDRQRGSSGFGPGPLGFETLGAWSHLMHVRPTPFEIECLLALDRLCLDQAHAKRKATS